MGCIEWKDLYHGVSRWYSLKVKSPKGDFTVKLFNGTRTIFDSSGTKVPGVRNEYIWMREYLKPISAELVRN